jgi:flagellar biosynthetic protein FlhB
MRNAESPKPRKFHIFHKFDLQLFAGEKTEKATPRRREDARKKGQVLKSQEVNTLFVLLAVVFFLKSYGSYMFQAFNQVFVQTFQHAGMEFIPENLFALFVEILWQLAILMMPVLLVALVSGVTANVLQVGFLFTTETLKFDLGKISPAKGFKRIFSKRALMELFKSCCKIGLIAYVSIPFLMDRVPAFSSMMDAPIGQSMGLIGDSIFTVAWRILVIIALIAAADYIFQWYEYEESLKMSKQDIKDEYKNIEGDPQIKAKIKEKQRQLSQQRMMQDVPKSSVVITNPTHYAVALQYSEDMEAPRLLAKGRDLVARRIREIALEADVPIVENRELARLIYDKVDIGRFIPEEMFQAVAEILAYVYRMRGRI